MAIDQDRALFVRFARRRDPGDREVLVERYLPLARCVAMRYVRHGEPLEDILQVAYLGLVKAIDRFDVERGRAFTSFAVPTIAGEIKRYYRDRTWALHVPRECQERALAVRRVAAQLERENHREPTVHEIAVELEAADEDVLEALLAARAQRVDSLDAPAGAEESSGTIGDEIGVDEAGYVVAEDRVFLAELLRLLSPRDRLVLRLSFERDLTQAEIGTRVGLSQMQISRLRRKSMERLRTGAQVGTREEAHAWS